MKDYDMYADEFELEYENEFEFDDDEFEYEGDFEYHDDGEFEYDDDEFEFEGEFEYDDDELFDEDEELELAEALLSAGSEEELEYFLGGLIRRGISKAKGFVKRRGRGLVRRLKGRAKKFAKGLLPRLGRRAGKALGGGRFGKISGLARQFFGFELEMVAPEEQELEVARKVVRITKSAANNLVKAAKRGLPPNDQVVKAAMKSAIKKHMSGGRGRGSAQRGGRSGRWVKRGRRIILMGV